MQSIIFLDIAAVAILLVLADLSKRLGEALKIQPVYKVLYGGVVFIVLAAIINSITFNSYANIQSHLPTYVIITMALRFIAGCFAVFACMQYWQWLITEMFKK